MRPLILQTLITLAIVLASAPAFGLCGGRTVAEEFREADVVVRAKLVSQMDAWDDEPSPAFTAEWGGASTVFTLYGLRILETFKGRPAERLHVFEEHNSGAFYIDSDKDYLLFLKRIPTRPAQPTKEQGALFVPYACGHSKPIDDVDPEALADVRALAGRR